MSFLIRSDSNKASMPFVDEAISNNKTIFLPVEDVKKLIPPGNVDNVTRRVMTRYFTQLKTGA